MVRLALAVAAVLFTVVALSPAPTTVLLPLFVLAVIVLVVAPLLRLAIRVGMVGVAVYGAGRLLGRGVRDGWDRGETCDRLAAEERAELDSEPGRESRT